MHFRPSREAARVKIVIFAHRKLTKILFERDETSVNLILAFLVLYLTYLLTYVHISYHYISVNFHCSHLIFLLSNLTNSLLTGKLR